MSLLNLCNSLSEVNPMQVFEADLISTIRSFTRAGDISEESFLDHAERPLPISPTI